MAHSQAVLNGVTLSQNVVARAVGDETVLLALDSGIYFTLNPVGTLVWRGLENAESIDQIVDRIVSEYDAPAARVKPDIIELLGELTRRGLVLSA